MNKRKYKDALYKMRKITDLKDLINSSADLFANKTAFFVKDVPGGDYRPIPYRKLKEDVDALGTWLVSKGLSGEKIAILGENSYEWVVTYLAVVNGSGVAVPLDRELHPKEVGNLLKRSGAVCLAHSKKMSGVSTEAAKGLSTLQHMICMEEIPALIETGKQKIAEGDRRFIEAEIDPDALCALLFTSGTTGLAKGVMLSHRNISANVYNMSKYVKIMDGGIGLSVLPMHHSYEMTCHIFTALYQGIAVAICEGLKYIAKNMAEIHATVMLGVPLVFESMHKKIWKQAQATGKEEKMKKALALSKRLKLYNHPKIVKWMFKEIHMTTGNAVDQFIAGGAAINPKVIEDFEAMGFPMMQGYGMTENAPIIAVNRDKYSKKASVGPVMPGTEVRIDSPDAAGMGEIVCRGPSVMLGYYDDPVETEKVLRDGWLYTGDYGYFDEEGFLYIAGRKKNVIVTKNGKNIFPEEVEFYLTENPYILEALVYGLDDDKSEDVLVKAEIYPNYDQIAEEKGDLSEEEIRQVTHKAVEEANEMMPLYKRVKRFELRQTEFEKTTTRKIKRYTPVNFGESAKQEDGK